MYCLQILQLMVACLLHATSPTVYYVIPDEHYTTNNNSYTLQHYLNNINKYFVSHTQLHFLPGQYYLNTDLIIQHVSNLSLIGNRTNEVISSVIKCTSPAGVVVTGSSNIVITNIEMVDCGKSIIYPVKEVKENRFRLTGLFVRDSNLISIEFFNLMEYRGNQNSEYGFQFINVIGRLTDSYSNFLIIRYDNSTNNTAYGLHVSRCHYSSYEYITHALEIQQLNTPSDVTITIKQCRFFTTLAILNICIGCSGSSIVTVSHCSFFCTNQQLDTFDENQYSQNDDNFYYFTDTDLTNRILGHEYDENCGSTNTHTRMILNYYKTCTCNPKIQFIHCFFRDVYTLLQTINFHVYSEDRVQNSVFISIVDSLFYNNRAETVIWVCHYNYNSIMNFASLLIKNTTITSQSQTHIQERFEGFVFTISVRGMKVYLEDLSISNTPASLHSSVIISAEYSYLTFSGYNEISHNTAFCAIQTAKVYVTENSVLNITKNNFLIAFNNSYHKINTIEDCFIQYMSHQGNLDNAFQLGQNLNYSINFIKNNIYSKISNTNLKHCNWDRDSAFLSISPLRVNQKFIHDQNNFTHKHTSITEKRHICLCTSMQCCYSDEIESFFPGELVYFSFTLKNVSKGPVFVEKIDDSIHACKSESHLYRTDHENWISFQLEKNECKNVTYLLSHKNGKWCELCLLANPLYNDSEPWMEIYTILLKPCPKGFSLHPQGYCQCDPILSSHIPSLTTCDIDYQTIPRPANTWISANTINNSHSYHVSLHCPFDYCLPHSSQLNLSTPDSQCQFKRSGALCGQCQHGLSTMFGSSQCKHCSNINLLIIIPLGIAGIILLLLLFVLNLTVTDGKINSFLFYISIISINSSTFFSTNKSLIYTLTAFANLDLGIETCFYDGMGDYTKTWLQLVFPIYLIFIATLLIITSRYSTTIQRLTARRALPVLATLFLLSYTKVLLTVSNVLFSYTSITHLPSNHTTLVWSMDTSVPLFGVKFTILFIACLILFIILVPFNVVLIFTKKLSYFKIVTYFKPLLDAYQGPYKIKFYYWTGLQLVVRAVFFGVSAFDRDTNLMIGSIILIVIVWLHGKVSPFNSIIRNAIESSFLLNLIAVFIVLLYAPSNLAVNIFMIIAMLELLCIAIYNGLVYSSSIHERLRRLDITQRTIQLYRDFRQMRRSEVESVELVNAVPDVTFNYKEFQEPLLAIGNDN